MLIKTFKLLKNNPIIIIFQVVYIAISFLSSLLFLSVRQSEISYNMDYSLYCGKFLISTLLGILSEVVFLSGFGNSLSEAITSGKSNFTAFFVGIKKYFKKSMLSVLILYIINVGFSAILLPAFSQIILNIFVPSGDVRNVFYYIMIYIINILIMPFTTLFIPAIYIDRYDIIAGLITGMKLAVRNYWRLVWVFSAIYIPIIINIIFIKDTVLFVFTPLSAEYIRSPIDIISGNVFSVSVIMMYLLEGAIFLVSTPLFFVIYKESSSKRLLY
jgi:hypothetical protein